MSIEEISEHLTRVGYIVLDDPLQKTLSDLLFSRCQDDGTLRFKAAQIGRGAAKKQLSPLRGDLISWQEAEPTTIRDCSILKATTPSMGPATATPGIPTRFTDPETGFFQRSST